MQTEEILEMKRRHIDTAKLMQTMVDKEVSAWIQAIEEEERLAKEQDRRPKPMISVNELIKLSSHATTLERLTRGEPTEYTKTDNLDDAVLADLTVEELKLLKKIKAKIGDK